VIKLLQNLPAKV